jgi:hypothetical protein
VKQQGKLPANIELYWSRTTKYPSSKNHEGVSYKMGCIQVTDSERLFKEENIYIGIYSQSGVHLNIGCSFRTDHFATVPFSGVKVIKPMLMTSKNKVSEMKREVVIETLLSP